MLLGCNTAKSKREVQSINRGKLKYTVVYSDSKEYANKSSLKIKINFIIPEGN